MLDKLKRWRTIVVIDRILAVDFLILVFDLVSVLSAGGIAYYSFKLVVLTRHGILEKSWQFIVFGAAIFTLALLFYITEPFSERIWSIKDDVGTGLAALGLSTIMIGFRSHYSTWYPKELRQSKKEKQDEFLRSMK